MDPDICTGKPCIRGIRFPVSSLLAYLSSGMTYDGLLSEFPFLERDDMFDALSFSSEMLHDTFFPLHKAA
ncbi:DUF433 domain-containing protein [Spirosoma soli]|uniref:DUF433 domain-containing protein n=1 Tax=Spirosoma soli TaxID=1770529 RepID=A0ABW5M8S7_9BACT